MPVQLSAHFAAYLRRPYRHPPFSLHACTVIRTFCCMPVKILQAYGVLAACLYRHPRFPCMSAATLQESVVFAACLYGLRRFPRMPVAILRCVFSAMVFRGRRFAEKI